MSPKSWIACDAARRIRFSRRPTSSMSPVTYQSAAAGARDRGPPRFSFDAPAPAAINGPVLSREDSEGRMPAKDLGTKHVCFKCGTRFYDLNKAEPLCPKC